MVRLNEIRAGEVAVEGPPATDAVVVFIGPIHTPWAGRLEYPRQGRPDGPTCRIEVFERSVAALNGITQDERREVLHWLHLPRRDLVRQSPRNDGVARGAFSARTPLRPNRIGTQLVTFVRLERANLFMRGLDCVDGTPLVDLKPDRR